MQVLRLLVVQRLQQLAIGATNGKAEFHVSSGLPPDANARLKAEYPKGWDQSGSLRTPKTHKEKWPWCKFQRTIRVDVRTLDTKNMEKIGGTKVKQQIVVKEGIEQEIGKKIVRLLKDSKMKVQAAIQGEAVRITGAKRDDLQAAMALIRKEIDIMNHLHHCKLINLHDAFEDEDEMVLIFEL